MQGRRTLVLMLAAFGAYFSMYAFRKPITAAEFAGATFPGTGLDLKTALLIGQIVGYAASKYVGIVVCTTMGRERRALTLMGFIAFAEAALVAFAVLPGAWKVGAMFLNGLPLGMVWGLVVRYLEGRRTSEVLLAGLSVSFIVSSGVVKDIGLWLMASGGVPEEWMPAATGAIFAAPFVVCVRILDQAPPPDDEDEIARVPRRRMDGDERRRFLGRFGPSMVPLLVLFFFLTAYRDFRDNYGVEIFREMGYLDTPALFTRTDLPAGFVVLLALALLGLIRSNRRGLLAVYGLMWVGLLIVAVGTALFAAGSLSGMGWMVVVGVGSYLAYVPVGAVLFDRLTAAGGTVGTAVFGIYLADAVGYTGSVLVQLYKDLAEGELTRLAFFRGFSLQLALWGSVCLLISGALVWRALATRTPTSSPRPHPMTANGPSAEAPGPVPHHSGEAS